VKVRTRPRAADEFEKASDFALLVELIGESTARRTYRGSLGNYFSGWGTPEKKCIVARELVRRWLSEEMHSGPLLDSPAHVRTFLQLHFADQEFESFVVLFLDAQNRLISMEDMFRGTLTQTSVYPREIVKAALQRNAASVMLAHNHPSGVASPSQADESLTQTLKSSLNLVDVRLLDHFVVTKSGVASFAELGLI
jgi:DNA repair protein RadC